MAGAFSGETMRVGGIRDIRSKAKKTAQRGGLWAIAPHFVAPCDGGKADIPPPVPPLLRGDFVERAT